MSDDLKHVVAFEEVQKEELARIRSRREQAGLSREQLPEDLTGLSLSGGGIRSATFNLGLLQALERWEILPQVDYLSTVSGGGYIGACLTWFRSRLQQAFPFGTRRKDNSGLPGQVLAWLRAHGSYLTPGDGMTLWALIAAITQGILVNLIILIPLFLLVIFLLSLPLGQATFFPTWLREWLFDASSSSILLFDWLFAAGKLLMVGFLGLTLIGAMLTGIPRFRTFLWQRKMRVRVGKVLMWAVLFTAVGTVPAVYKYLSTHLSGWMNSAISGISLTGVLSLWGGLRGRRQGQETRGRYSALLSTGLSLLIYSMFLWFFHVVNFVVPSPWLYGLAGVSGLLALLANVNHTSMHRYYRNRLMEAYLPYAVAGEPLTSADGCYLHELPQTDAPYHLINTNLVTTGSEDARLQARGGDNFVLSPLYCGAASTGYLATEVYDNGHMNLATAMAISGAAVNPNNYFTRSRPLSFLMTLLNVRLGYWIHNPRFPWWKVVRPTWYYYMFRELFGQGLNETDKYVHLSDGGHFENLGVYELIRRRCKYIIVSDAGADPDWNFNDLARAIELVRVDFGAKIELPYELLRPRGEERTSPRAFVVGKITYVDGTEGRLLYIKTAFLEDVPADVFSYRRGHPEFPDQSTGDQFFDEQQFEAYRELGYHIGR
ncbi:MAG: hypothetical protein D6681_03205, partial [Calditrichaeota bacterium]